MYEQEDSEIEFLDSFIDYDDISIIYKSVEEKEKRDVGDENEIIVVTNKDEATTREIVINGSEPAKTEKTSMRERLTWLRSKGRLMLRSLSCNCLGQRYLKPRPQCEVLSERSKEERGSDDSQAEEQKDLVQVKSFHIKQGQVKIKTIETPDDHKNYHKAVTELENLEKLILRDSVRETFLKQRGMETIREEADLSFNNLSYGLVRLDEANLNNYYENLKQETQNVYENVGLPVQTDEQQQHYENLPTPVFKMSNEDEYESYDFGEEGIYQNVMFTNGSSSINCPDGISEVATLQKRVNEVNDIISIEPTDRQPETETFKSNLIVTLSKPKCKEEKIGSKSVASRPPQKPLRSISNNFKTWALSKAEHPKVDVNKLPKQKLVTTELFSQEERNVVSDFLKTCKEELKIN